jgi:hypothetical protein
MEDDFLKSRDPHREEEEEEEGGGNRVYAMTQK